MRAFLGLAVVCTAVVSCEPSGPSALRVRVLVDPGVAATCVVLRVTGGSGSELRQLRGLGAVEREFTVDRNRTSLPDRVRVTAGASIGNGCSDPQTYTAWTDELEGTFAAPPGPALVLHLSPPPPSLDGDGDGFPSSADCDDADALVHPRAPEACLAGMDADCDGLVGCADPNCSPGPCAPRATRLAFDSPPQSLSAGQCSAPVILQAVDDSGAQAGVPRELAISLSASPLDSLRFFVDDACTVPLSLPEVYLGPGTLPAQFHARAVSGGIDVLQASSSTLGSADQALEVRPMVLSGTCTLTNYTSRVTCPSPFPFDPAHSLLVFQATSSDNTPSNTDVYCSIASGSSVECRRFAYSGDEPIAWQILQRAEISVRHLVTNLSGSPHTITIPAVAGESSTFLLTSYANSGSSQGTDDFRYAQLVSPTSVVVTSSGGGGGTLSLQVVEWSGAAVTRGVTPPMEGTTLDVTDLPPVDLSRSFLTYSYRTPSGTAAICDRSLRGELISPTAIRFHRGDGNPACAGTLLAAIGWERIQLPRGVRVQASEVAMAPSQATQTVSISAVDPTRSLLLAGGQFTSGQAAGEGSFDQDDVLGEMLGAFTFEGAAQVGVQRAAALGSARWTLFVVEVPP